MLQPSFFYKSINVIKPQTSASSSQSGSAARGSWTSGPSPGTRYDTASGVGAIFEQLPERRQPLLPDEPRQDLHHLADTSWDRIRAASTNSGNTAWALPSGTKAIAAVNRSSTFLACSIFSSGAIISVAHLGRRLPA